MRGRQESYQLDEGILRDSGEMLVTAALHPSSHGVLEEADDCTDA